MRKGLCQYAYDRCCYLRTCDFQIYIHICIMPQFSLPKKKNQNEGLCFSLGYLLWKRYIVWALVSAIWRVLVTIHSTDVGAPDEHGMFSHELLSELNSALIAGQWQSWVWLQSDTRDCTLLVKLSCWVKWTTHGQCEYISLSLVDS